MGRGRAKAKQTKVARRLKYTTPGMDLDALRQELSGDSGHQHYEGAEDSDFDDDSDEFEYDEDLYAKYLDDEDDEDDDEDEEDVASSR